MPAYNYIARSQPRKIIEGKIEAESEQDAVNKLANKGYFPISIQLEDLSQYKRGVFSFRKVCVKDLAILTRQLSVLTGSGVNILNGLNIISAQTSNKYLKAILSDIISKIKDGRSLSETLATHPYLFSDLYISMIRAGEVGGNLELTLKRLADFLEKEEEFKSSLAAALAYPSFIFVISGLTVIILLGFVIPRLTAMFEDMGQVLPLPTRILIAVSSLLRSYWWIILAFISSAVFLLRRLLYLPQGKIFWDSLKLKFVILGQIILKTEISRFARTLSLLLSSGIPIVYSLDIAISTAGNHIFKAEVQKIKEYINRGLSFSYGLKNTGLFPGFVTNIVAVGEETGTLEKSLLGIADDYEKDTQRSLNTLTRLLEPAIILVMGLIVGFIVLSMLLPIFEINFMAR